MVTVARETDPLRVGEQAGFGVGLEKSNPWAFDTAQFDSILKRLKVVLKWEDVEIGEPGDGDIRVRNKAIGLNFIDVYFRKGVYKAATMPFTPGMKAVGEVIVVGPGLTGRKVGDLVGYAGNPMG
ncbi:hypothetical protein Dsin_012640 [Dipteronia sinensis]|uniref:Alcohol dehydrogenase-like N-terminal domain-containing protein n=1 Tax=Dipteronia sinensis TaxID=43782 RepID=A0AAE0AJB5_9ROSI|nr:hypothetical protein Dsin_012640 [Dipteronia sinensis]